MDGWMLNLTIYIYIYIYTYIHTYIHRFLVVKISMCFLMKLT